MTYDAVIVGTGPAGLSAALTLGDCAVEINDLGQTSIPGVYAAGDLARRSNVLVAGAQAILAAAEGTVAAAVVDQELLYT
jgi:thioredoxin reductase